MDANDVGNIGDTQIWIAVFFLDDSLHLSEQHILRIVFLSGEYALHHFQETAYRLPELGDIEAALYALFNRI